MSNKQPLTTHIMIDLELDTTDIDIVNKLFKEIKQTLFYYPLYRINDMNAYFPAD